MTNEMTTSQLQTLALYTQTVDRLFVLVEGLPEFCLDTRRAPAEWSIRQIVHHLSDDCDVWSMLVKKAIATPGVLARFEGFPGNEAWADGLDFHIRPIGLSLALIRAHQSYLSELVTHFSSAWDRNIVITVDDPQSPGPMQLSVADILKMLVEHLDEHLATIQLLVGSAEPKASRNQVDHAK